MAGASRESEQVQHGGTATDPTRALDVQSIGRLGAAVAWTAALAGAAGAYYLVVAGGRTALTGGILLGVVALVGLAVGLQATGEPWPGEPGYGERAETDEQGAQSVDPSNDAGDAGMEPAGADAGRPLPLADRLALGLLGGVLGGIAVAVGIWLVDAAGIADLLGVRIVGALTATSLALRAWYGALWGVALALLYPRLPGGSAVARGTLFGVAPALYALLILYPLVLGLGWFAAGLGTLAFVFVLLFHLLWGGVVGALFQWAQVTDLGVLSRPLVGR